MKNKTTSLAIAGIPVEIQRKNIKNLHLYVLPPDGRVRISVPARLSDEAAAEFVRSKLDWIRRQQEKIAGRQHPEAPEYVSGENLTLFGKPYPLDVEYSSGKHSVQLSPDGRRVILNVKPDSTREQREKTVREWYRGLLMERIERLLPEWERITGLYCSSWQIKNMKTRWGTCNIQTRKIWLNLQLAKHPTECLEYVILHELAHLKAANHGKEFEAVLNRYMPDWRERKAVLNARTPSPEEI